MDEADRALCQALRGTPDVWRHLDGPMVERFLGAASRHRVRPLLAWRLHGTGELPAWPAPIRRALLDTARGEAALEVIRRFELRRLLDAFAAAGVPVLVLKGAALAYATYAEPWLRPREDTDLLVRGDDALSARRVLADAGYHPTPMQSGTLVSHQQLYVRIDGTGRRYACDLHWKIANPVAFSDLLSPEDLLREAAAVSLDGCTVRIPSRVDALLLACWHRVAHHRDSENLLWLYDLHLLGDDLPDADAARMTAMARRTGTQVICARGLSMAAERFGSRVPPPLLLAPPDAADDRAALTAVYLDPQARKVDRLAADLRALPGWRSRLRLLREHLFPPAEYMFATSGRSARALLPALYVRRIARGALAWFRRPAE